MAKDLVTTDLSYKTALADDDEFLIFDSEDIDTGTSLPYWKRIKAENTILDNANVASRIYLEMHIF